MKLSTSVLTLAGLFSVVALQAATVSITEFMAANIGSLRDEDGDSSDWIEIHNSGTEPVNLNGWSLTDDLEQLSKWMFPELTLPPGGYQVVFASDKDRRLAGKPLHTNFRLLQAGEFLALVEPGAGIVSAFSPAFPPQRTDVSYGRDRLEEGLVGFYETPTPGAANGTIGGGFAPEVEFSVASGTFTAPFALTLKTAVSNAIIRYVVVTNRVLATNAVSSADPIYAAPIPIDGSMQVRARAFVDGQLPGSIRTETYVGLSPEVAEFTSDLPLVLINNFGAGNFPFSQQTLASSMAVFEPAGGRASLLEPPKLITRAGIDLRGSATLAYPKPSLNVETWDEFNDDRDVSVLGFPAESDWILYAPNNFQPGLLSQPLAYELSRRMGRYAPRTRFVEVFINTTTGRVTTNHYAGVYVLMEKIKRNPGRVDIDRLDVVDTNYPAVSGGYLLKIDRVEPHERILSTPEVGPILGAFLIYQDPEGSAIQGPLRAAQRNYIGGYFGAFVTNLGGASFSDPVNGYARFIDPAAWVDQHLLAVFAFQVDALRLNTFFHKPRDIVNERGEVVRAGRLIAGPAFDFVRVFGSTDGRDINPRTWRSPTGDLGTDFFNHSWWGRLFTDPDFWQRWIDRWQELRGTILADESLFALVDSYREELREAQPREFARWRVPSRGTNGTGTGTYDTEIAWIKNWLHTRADFIDTNFLAAPRLTANGITEGGFIVSLVNPAGVSEQIYYSLDGSDPRLPGGGISPAARLYSGAVAVTSNAHVFARAYDPNHRNLTGVNRPPLSSPWSGPVARSLVIRPPALRLTEIMYHPVGDPNRPLQFEFLELKNIGEGDLNVGGFKLRGAVDFVFPHLVLGPGEYLVVAGDEDGFRSRYGTAPRLAGVYRTALNDDEGRLILEGPVGEVIHEFSYRGDWYPITDGLGFSLVIRDALAPLQMIRDGQMIDTWGLASSWRASAGEAGSPGADDPSPVFVPPVRVNEVLSRPGLAQSESIELFNPLASPADIGGWFLSDDSGTPRKYRVPNGTILAAGGYQVFDESQFAAGPGMSGGFHLRATGGEVFLFSADNEGDLTGHSHHFRYGAAATGQSVGRYETWDHAEDFVAQREPTLPGPNSGPRIGPVVISELHYHPTERIGSIGQPLDNVGDEFIELQNITDTEVLLFDPERPANAWQISGAVRFVFPSGATIPPQAFAVVVSFDSRRDAGRAQAFRERYGLPADARLWGPFTGSLPNEGGVIELSQADHATSSTGVEISTLVAIDRLRFSNFAPWPAAADGIGLSLQRLRPGDYGNDPANWAAGGPTPGAPHQDGVPPLISCQPSPQTVVAYLDATFNGCASGAGPILYQWRHAGRNVPGATQPVLVLTNVGPEQAGAYSLVAYNAAGAVESATAILTILIPPEILIGPQSQTVRAGTNVTFTVVASGAEPLTYQWRFKDRALPGATNQILELANVQGSDEGEYSVIVTDSVAPRRSLPARLLVLRGPVITLQPLDQTVVRGGTAIMSVQAEGTLPMGFRWRRFGATTAFQVRPEGESFLVLSNLQTNGTYTVVVTNQANSIGVISIPVALTIVDDTDRDGIPDEVEAASGLDPNNAADAVEDEDGDGATNLEEHIAGTNLRDSQSYLKVTRITPAGPVTIEFTAQAGRTYSLLYRNEATSGPWRKLADIVAGPTARTETVGDPNPGTVRFYRLVTPVEQ